MCRQAGNKPNFSELGRRYGLDRHTVASYWKAGRDPEDARRDRESAFDQVREVIEEKAQMPGATKRGVYEYLLDRHAGLGLPGYNAFTEYTRKRDIVCGLPAQGAEPHPRYETPPGRQLQFDYKEDLSMHDRLGTVYEFNIFSATLGASRLHRFVYSPTKTTDDTMAGLLEVGVRNGGFTDVCTTDNMSSLVTIRGGRRLKVERAWRFAEEAGFRLELCKPRTPQTKGKDESANRFLSRLSVYDGDFLGEDELIAIIARIEARCNSVPNETTKIPPAILFARDEKEQLKPIGNLSHLEAMIGVVSVQTVPSTMLVRAAGREWSVPRRCIGHKAKVLLMPSGQLRITVRGELVAIHDTAAAQKPINYAAAHYAEALACKERYADADIEAAAKANLELLDRLGQGGAL